MTSEEPPTSSSSQAQQLPAAPGPQQPDFSTLPHATVIPTREPSRAVLESDTQSHHGDVYLLAGDVLITYNDHTLRADSLSYNDATGEIIANGHIRLAGGANDEYIEASHGTYNLQTGTGRFYDVSGSVGMHRASTPKTGYTSPNPMLFTGRMVVKTGERNYEVYDGSVTTCLLPNPDWRLSSSHFSLDDNKAKASVSTFRLLGIPVLFLPYVTHPVDSDSRQSGLLIPDFNYTNTKGIVIGEAVYFVLGRSADLTIGSQYYSSRGFAESSTFRYRGVGDDFFNFHFSALQDRGYYADSGVQDASGNEIYTYVNQGGQDVTAAFRRKFTQNLRAVGDVEYLSSYVYREAFTENFNQAISSDIDSLGYLVHQNDGYSVDGRADRYQGLKRVPIGTEPDEQIRIFHAPAFDFTALDHPIPGTPLFWSMTSSVAGLKRVQPNFVSSGITERLDLRPELSLPLSGFGWHSNSSIAVRETFYSRSRQAPYGNGATPVELTSPINRADVDINVDIRPPAIERTFQVPASLQKYFGTEVRHTVEPEVTYRNVHGIDNFLGILRFDDNDLASDTDELEYGVTQHLYFKPLKPASVAAPAPKPGCPVTPALDSDTGTAAASEALPDVLDPTPEDSNDANGIPDIGGTAPDSPIRVHKHADPCAPAPVKPVQQEWFSWRLTQRHFFAENFGGAVIKSRRNIFDTTLSLSGIAFLTEARSISPLVSRMRFRSSSHTDIEWDFDLDTGAKKFNSSNIFIDAHEGKFFGGLSFARLNAPGRFYTEQISNTNPTNPTLTSSAVSDFTQMRLLFGYGAATSPGLSLAGSAGIDLNVGSAQYITVQPSYNWNCCGLTLEYRKYDLGTVRNEGSYKFSFTLVNIGTAGNLRRAERLF